MQERVMRRFLSALMTFIFAVVLGHFTALHLIPNIIMDKAIASMEARGVELGSFLAIARTTPQTQTVVRPSPDLAYSICRFDFTDDESLWVNAGRFGDYTSVSFFDARTNNFASIRIEDKTHPHWGTQILLHPPGKEPFRSSVFPAPQFEAPTRKGLILIRRLAPTNTDFDAAAIAARGDRCETIADKVVYLMGPESTELQLK